MSHDEAPPPPTPELMTLGLQFTVFLNSLMGPEQAHKTIDLIAQQVGRCREDGYELGLIQSHNPTTDASTLTISVSSPTAEVRSLPALITHLRAVQTHASDHIQRN